MVIERGDIWWANLPPPEGSGPGFRRPLLVVSINAPGNVRLPARRAGLSKASVINVSQLVTLDKSIPARRAGMRLVLGL
jgi:mRNA interferase MazF